MIRGDSTPFPFRVTRKDPTTGATLPVSLTGAVFTFTAKYREDDAQSAAVFTRTSASGVEIVNAADGRAQVRLAPANTTAFTLPTTLYWDIQMVDNAGDTYTVDSGYLMVMPDITTP